MADTLTDEHIAQMSAGMWGFLNSCLSGDAEQEFKGVPYLQGFEAWRRAVAMVDKGKALRIERLRGEYRILVKKPIKSLEQLQAGIVSFENKVQELEMATGKRMHPDDKLSDLKGILPREIKDNLVWMISDTSRNYGDFVRTLQHQVAKVLLGRKDAGVHNIGEQDYEAADPDDGAEDLSTHEGVIAAIMRLDKQYGSPAASGRTSGVAQEE